jgi:hypothetical protein
VDTTLLVELDESGADDERRDHLARALRGELLELDVDSVEQATSGPAPDGTRGLDAASIGALVVTASASVDLVAKVVHVLRSWLRSSPPQTQRTLKITVAGQTLELENASEAQQEQLIGRFLEATAHG